jgi:ComF family protein
MNTALAQLADGLGDVVFPRCCVHCGGLIENRGRGFDNFRHVCPRCAALLEIVGPPHCPTCGHPYYGLVEGEKMCSHCEGLDPVFGEGRTAVLFKGAARALVIELKYHEGLHALADMGEIFRRAPGLLAHARGATLVPVPLHPRKERERGFNQAALLAGVLAGVAGGTTRVEPLLRRVIDSPSQTAFDRRSRMDNLKNAFALARRGALNSRHHFILVDDVFTTGSTLNSCARALRSAGGMRIDVITFGHG